MRWGYNQVTYLIMRNHKIHFPVVRLPIATERIRCADIQCCRVPVYHLGVAMQSLVSLEGYDPELRSYLAEHKWPAIMEVIFPQVSKLILKMS